MTKPTIDMYRFCVDCNMVFDFWKYDDLKSAGHDGHKVRQLTEEEYKVAVENCREAGCFEES